MKSRVRVIDAEIPTSSTADIAFLLIIYFMLTTTFSATLGLDLRPPEPGPEGEVVEMVESVLVRVPVRGALEVDGRPLAIEDLLSYLAPILEHNPGKSVIVQTDPDTSYGRAVDVLDELRQGKQRLGLAQEIQIAIPTQREIDLYWPS